MKKILASEDSTIDGLKPNKETMKKEIVFPVNEILLISDREEKDDYSAGLIEMGYCDINNFRKNIGKWRTSANVFGERRDFSSYLSAEKIDCGSVFIN